jgi:hypothetical protein
MRFLNIFKKKVKATNDLKPIIGSVIFQGSAHDVQEKYSEWLSKLKPTVEVVCTSLTKGHTNYHSPENYVLIVTYKYFIQLKFKQP